MSGRRRPGLQPADRAEGRPRGGSPLPLLLPTHTRPLTRRPQEGGRSVALSLLEVSFCRSVFVVMYELLTLIHSDVSHFYLFVLLLFHRLILCGFSKGSKGSS